MSLDAKVMVRVMCTFDIEVEHYGSDVPMEKIAELAQSHAVRAVQAAEFGKYASLAPGTLPSATPRRVEAKLEIA